MAYVEIVELSSAIVLVEKMPSQIALQVEIVSEVTVVMRRVCLVSRIALIDSGVG